MLDWRSEPDWRTRAIVQAQDGSSTPTQVGESRIINQHRPAERPIHRCVLST
jgi:hypothetical protein